MPAALAWRHLTGELALDRTLVMGVLNLTPDSFFDRGRFLDPDVALLHGLEMIEDGADLLDIGGESTRPGSEPVPAEEEWRRVAPVIEGLARRVDVPISIDTRKPEIAKKAIHAGASIVNDVTGLGDPRMIQVVARPKAGAVVMHMLGEPGTMQENPTYKDVVREVRAFLDARVRAAVAGGVPQEAIAVDPGIGFGKGLEHNLAILRHLDRFASLGKPLVIGVSRKSFLGLLGAGDVEDRLPGSLAAASYAVLRGAHVVRAHDVYETVQATRVIDALRVH